MLNCSPSLVFSESLLRRSRRDGVHQAALTRGVRARRCQRHAVRQSKHPLLPGIASACHRPRNRQVAARHKAYLHFADIVRPAPRCFASRREAAGVRHHGECVLVVQIAQPGEIGMEPVTRRAGLDAQQGILGQRQRSPSTRVSVVCRRIQRDDHVITVVATYQIDTDHRPVRRGCRQGNR